MPVQYEYTDTFGGEANYAWVNRGTLPNGLTDLQAMRRAKARVGLTGVRGRTYRHGDLTEFRPYRMCTVLFVTWSADGPEQAAEGEGQAC